MGVRPGPCPLPLEPRLLAKPWGGRRLESWGKPLPPQGRFGESWELYDDAEGSSRVAAGPAAERYLADLARAWGPALAGTGSAGGGTFPLMVKLLDARENLSVQVHPDDALARELHGPAARGKSEAWVVLEAAPGARLYNGFRPGTQWKDVERALERGTVDALLNAREARVGDLIEVPAGRVHALGAGCLVAEVQQNSDHTYRLWDWNRLEGGRPRILHPEQSRRALRFGAEGCADGLLEPRSQELPWGQVEGFALGCPFVLERWTLAPGRGPTGSSRLWALLCVAGGTSLRWRGQGARDRDLESGPGALTLLPAGLPVELRAGPAGAVVLAATPA